MKPALKSFYLKIKNENNRLIGMVGIIEPPIQYVAQEKLKNQVGCLAKTSIAS